MTELIRKYYPHYKVSEEYYIPRTLSGHFLPPLFMRWRLDVHAIYYACQKCKMFYDRVAIEIDTPGKGHGTRITIPQDRFRDKFFAENDCIRTVRLNTGYVWGRKKMQDDVILAELSFINRSSGGTLLYPVNNSNI